MVSEQMIDVRLLLGRAEIKNLPMIVVGDSGFFVSEFIRYDWQGKIEDRHVSLGGRIDGLSCLPYIPMEYFRAY